MSGAGHVLHGVVGMAAAVVVGMKVDQGMLFSETLTVSWLISRSAG
jgi:hypothetical protein